jgi:hypothetical protein
VGQSSEVFTKSDLRNMLRARAYALRAQPIRHTTPHDAARRQGYMAALIEIGIELGIIELNAQTIPED